MDSELASGPTSRMWDAKRGGRGFTSLLGFHTRYGAACLSDCTGQFGCSGRKGSFQLVFVNHMSSNSSFGPFTIQKSWYEVISAGCFLTLLRDVRENPAEVARLRGVEDRPCGAWLTPAAPLGTLMDRSTFRVAAAFRLGVKICQPHICRRGKMVDEKAQHGLNCSKRAGRMSRHFGLNAMVHRYLIKAGHPSML